MHLNSLGIAGSSGSTCSSQALKVSHVLEAIGVEPVWAQGSVTFSLGIENTPAEVDVFLKELPAIVEELRKISPLVAKHRSQQAA
jgi:cysteine desulfurase